MLSRLLSGVSAGKASVGIEVVPGGLALGVCKTGSLQVAAGNDNDTQVTGPEISHIALLDDASSDGEQGRALSDWVHRHDLQHSPASLVLPASDYQILLVEAPDVDKNELREAIRWRVKDLISIPVEKAVLDVFLLPEDGSRSGKTMAYVVAAQRERIVELAELVNESGLELASIDIAELALRNLVCIKELSMSERRGVALVRLSEGRGVVSLYRNGNMYLSRQFNIQYGGGLLDDIPVDSFLLEVQRSLDYHERQMGQVSPTALYLCGENVSEDKITMDIARGLSVPVRYLNMETTLRVSDSMEESLLHSCAAAIGGALRDDLARCLQSPEKA